MSYGFYKLPHGSSRDDYLIKVAGNIPFAIGVRTEDNSREKGHMTIQSKPLEPPRVDDTMVSDNRSKAKTLGYTGNVCTHCHGTRMKMAGHCEVCEDCGESSGCS